MIMEFNENNFKSVFKKNITDYLNEKKLLNQKYKTLFFSLRDFDNMCWKLNVTESILTKELVIKWLEKKPNECLNNQSKRASMIRCFGRYMYRFNTKNYILPSLLYPIKEKYKPHIYTNDEIQRLFAVVDNLIPTSCFDHKPDIMPIIFRILLFTGMRINEILSLKISDIKFDEKIIVIKNAKNNKDRLIPISKNLYIHLKKYNSKINKNIHLTNYLFRNNHGNKITSDSFYEYFRIYLWKAKIPHTGKGPRVHDFRHTHIVNCIHKWLKEGKNIKTLLPYLQTYLGHSTIESTYYYYHLTLSIYPYLEKKANEYDDKILPKIKKGDFDE